MDHSVNESDMSLSPSRILERLHILRQLQLLQRGKLQNQQVQLSESSNITEMISHFSNSTSYNTFQSSLQSSQESANIESPHAVASKNSNQLCEKDLLEGVAVLNLSKESEYIINSPLSTRSRPSNSESSPTAPHNSGNSPRKHIALDEMPILSASKQNFEEVLLENLQKETNVPNIQINGQNNPKKQFLRKGEGMARIGLRKNDLVIQNTKSLPWYKGKKKTVLTKQQEQLSLKAKGNKNDDKVLTLKAKELEPIAKTKFTTVEKPIEKVQEQKADLKTDHLMQPTCDQKKVINRKPLKVKHPVLSNNGKTWAAVLTKEQDDFLKQLKQSEFYKNFQSPTKSSISDVSYDDTLNKLRQEREIAEQNMFELLENKVANQSFHLENSFFSRFLNKNQLESSGESTPVVMQKCLSSNPNLLHIQPNLNRGKQNAVFETDNESECSDCTGCCSRDCHSPSTSCSCQTVETLQNTTDNFVKDSPKNSFDKKVCNKNNKDIPQNTSNQSHDDSVSTKEMKTNMEEMNAKLVATSELLKERLQELEDEIDTFRKENTNLVKMRNEFDQEKQKFFEEKSSFEQKFNEEKILSEYYIAEEKENLNKQKQMYERYVRDLRGRLNKKDKDEVINLKKEINNLKDEIRTKDAKSTTTIARLRNQLKIMDKEKKDMQDEIEKLKKTNKRIQHSNDITRRLTNMKHLAEINKKLSQMSSKDTQSEICLDKDIKYKAFEIERQSRRRNVQHTETKIIRPRAKSVPNLKVTSRYAKYFSQRDTISHMDNNMNNSDSCSNPSDNEPSGPENIQTLDDTDTLSNHDSDNLEEPNELEKLYADRFQSNSPKSSRSSLTNSISEKSQFLNTDPFFIHKSTTSSRDSKSPYQAKNTSPTYTKNISPTFTNFRTRTLDKKTETNETQILDRSKSPVSRISYLSGYNKNSMPTVIDARSSKLSLTPEPSSHSGISKTNLNPREIKKSDGSREIRFSNGNVKFISADGKYCKFVYYNGDIKENFYDMGRIKYFYAETKTIHTTHPDGLEVLEFADGQVEKRYKDGSSEIRLPNGSIRYQDPKNVHIREEWRFPDGTTVNVSANGEQRVVFSNGQVEVHAKDHKRREFPDGTIKLVYNDGTAETRYASGRMRIKDKHGNLILDSDSR